MKKNKIIILAEGSFGLLGSKTAACVIRYRQDEVVAVIDKSKAGMTAGQVLGFGGRIPVVPGLADALKYSPDSLLIGIAPKGGRLPAEWRAVLVEAISHGLDVYSGMHTFISDDPELVKLAAESGSRLVDLRKVPDDIPIAKCLADKVDAFVVLTVGTDCATGKMTVALEMAIEARKKGVRANFAATGQTGIYIAGGGIAVDRVAGDFIAGAAEKLVIDGARGNEVVLLEGQGSVFHPGYSGVALALLHGALPDALILCHQPSRKFFSDYNVRIPSVSEAVRVHAMLSGLLKPAPVIGVALNCFDMGEEETLAEIERTEKETGIPTTDCIKFGAGKLVDAMLERIKSGGKGRCASHTSL